VFAHGFLTVDGAKMSKSRGTFITAKSYLDCKLNPEWMRYYIAAKLNSHIEDIDLNLEDFISRVNSNLVGKYLNIAARAAGFISKRFDGHILDMGHSDLLAQLTVASDGIAADYEGREYGKALRDIMALADKVNAYVDANKPWELAKQEGQEARLHEVCSELINAFKILTVYLKPVLPKLAEDVEAFLNIAPLTWADSKTILPAQAINPYKHLMQRIEPELVAKLVDANKQALQATANVIGTAAHEPVAAPISIDDFAKVDLRVATVTACQAVEGSDKLLQFTVDLGFEQRTIFSGIKAAYQDPAELVGRQVIVVANLAPRKMRFGVSEGMIVCASGTDSKDGLFLLDVDAGAQTGMRVS
nr:methionine--tRNA ligase subunit beta [Neisseriaceae bacterium]